MPQFLIQFNYVPRSKRALIEQPKVDHAAQASKMVASLGGTVLDYWYAFGEFDGMVLIEAPDSSTVAAIAMAIGGTGEVSRLETTVLMTMSEAREAARKAGTATHLPPDEEGDR